MKTIGISWEYHRKTIGIHRETNFHPRDTIVTPEIQSRKTKWPPRDATSWCKMILWVYSYNSMCLLIVYSYKLCGWPPLPHSVWMAVPSYVKENEKGNHRKTIGAWGVTSNTIGKAMGNLRKAIESHKEDIGKPHEDLGSYRKKNS